jgi:hypothetical protein
VARSKPGARGGAERPPSPGTVLLHAFPRRKGPKPPRRSRWPPRGHRPECAGRAAQARTRGSRFPAQVQGRTPRRVKPPHFQGDWLVRTRRVAHGELAPPLPSEPGNHGDGPARLGAVVSDEEWFHRLGWGVSAAEGEPGVYEADIWPKGNPGMWMTRVTRSVRHEIAIRDRHSSCPGIHRRVAR